jgi:hypothetical protein
VAEPGITKTNGQLDASRFISDRFALDQFEEAYELFGHAADNGALKVVLTREGAYDVVAHSQVD